MLNDRDKTDDAAPTVRTASRQVGPELRGVFPSLPTAFTPEGELDAEGMRSVVRFSLAGGSHGLVLTGLAGEVDRLSSAERMQVLEVTLAECAESVPVVVGATAESLRASIELAEHAQRVGAAAVVLPPPAGAALGESDLVDFLVAVADAVSLPVIVQDAPEYLTAEVGPRAVLRAAERAENIRTVKLELGPRGIEAWRSALGEDFDIFCGTAGLYILDDLRAGAVGVMPAVDVVDHLVAVYEAEVSGDSKGAERMLAQLLPLLVFELQSIRHLNGCVKEVLAARGVPVSPVLRAPGAAPLSAGAKARLAELLTAIGIDGSYPGTAARRS
jgi:2-keto-3-deoxy-L-arabinonate dehydratase